MVEVDPVLVAIVVVMMAFAFFIYLMIRRTAQQFKQGMDRGREEGGQ